jgi:hypothetical protein
MRLDPAGEAFYAYFIGTAYVQMGRYPEAIPFLERNIAAYPHEPWAHINLLVAFTELGQPERREQKQPTACGSVSAICPRAARKGCEQERSLEPAISITTCTGPRNIFLSGSYIRMDIKSLYLWTHEIQGVFFHQNREGIQAPWRCDPLEGY